MKRISAYQSSDGQLFDDKKSCALHQASLNMVEGLKAVGNRMDNDYALLCGDLGLNAHAIVTSDQFAEFVMKHADEIKLALAGKSLTAKPEQGE